MTRLLLLIFAGALLLAGCARHDPNVIVLTYASPYQPSHPFGRADQQWIDWVEAASHGRIRIKAFWGGALLSSDQSMEEIRHGVADIGLITPIYALGNVHAQHAQVGFYGHVGSIDQQVAVYKCLAATFPVLRLTCRVWTGPNDGAVSVAKTAGWLATEGGTPLPPARPARMSW